MSICNVCEKEFPNLENHHIQSVVYGGTNANFNICNICPNCHELVHRGIIIIEGKFGSTKGVVLIWRKQGETSIIGMEDPKVFLRR